MQVTDQLEEKVTLAVLRADLQHLTFLVQSGFVDVKADQVAMNVQLKILNGSNRENRDALIRDDQRIGNLEKFRDAVIKYALMALAGGVGIGAVAFGLCKAAGWW